VQYADRASQASLDQDPKRRDETNVYTLQDETIAKANQYLQRVVHKHVLRLTFMFLSREKAGIRKDKILDYDPYLPIPVSS